MNIFKILKLTWPNTAGFHYIRQVFKPVQQPAQLGNIAHFNYQVKNGQIAIGLHFDAGHIHPLIGYECGDIAHQAIPVEGSDADRNWIGCLWLAPAHLD